MSIPLSCECGQKFKAKDSLAGRRVKCPICGAAIQVPQSSAEAAKPQAAGKPATAKPKAAARPKATAKPKPAAKPQVAAQARPAAEDPLGLGDDLLGQSFDPLASPNLPSGMGPATQPTPYLATPAKAPAAQSGISPVLWGVYIGGGALLLLVVGAIGVIWMTSSGGGDDAVAVADGDAGQDSPTPDTAAETSDSASPSSARSATPRAAKKDSGAPASKQASADANTSDSVEAVDEDSKSPGTSDVSDDSTGADEASETPTPAVQDTVSPQQLAKAKKRREDNAQLRPKLGTKRPGKPYCMFLAEEYLLAVNAEHGGDVRMNEFVDWEELYENACFGKHVNQDFRDRFMGGHMEYMMGPQGLATKVVQDLKAGGSYTLLRVHDKDDQRRLLFRWIKAESGFGYHDMITEEYLGEGALFIDWYDFASGELFSDTVRRSYLAMVADADKSLLEGLPGWEGKFVQNIEDFQLLQHSASDQPQVALDAFNNLSEELQKEKRILMLRLLAASRIGSKDEFQKALADLRKFHPDDPSVDILSINYHIAQGDTEEAMQSIVRLEKAVGGDPYLDVVRYDVFRVTGDVRRARRYGNNAVKKDPSLKRYLKPLNSIRPKNTRDVRFEASERDLAL